MVEMYYRFIPSAAAADLNFTLFANIIRSPINAPRITLYRKNKIQLRCGYCSTCYGFGRGRIRLKATVECIVSFGNIAIRSEPLVFVFCSSQSCSVRKISTLLRFYRHSFKRRITCDGFTLRAWKRFWSPRVYIWRARPWQYRKLLTGIIYRYI